MKVKLIAIVVAGLFAQGAYADEDFVWGGSAQVGGRGTSISGSNVNGAYGSSTPLTWNPFQGPSNTAKAQEYQDINSAPIGVLDIRGASRNYYLYGYGEEFGRDDQWINIVGGQFGSWKASIYNNDIPHNLSFNALTPLQNSGTTFMPNPGTPPYPPAQNPANWNYFNYSTQRNLTGGNFEVSAKTPFFFKVDYNEVQQTGTKAGGGSLGTGSGNGLIELGMPVNYKTQNTTVEGGYNTKQYGVKLAYLDSKFTDANNYATWTNFYMLNGADYSPLPPNNDYQKWLLSGYWKQLPWDSAILAKFTQSKLTNNVSLNGLAYTSSLKPVGNTVSGQSQPPGVGYLFTQPVDSSGGNVGTFNGDIKTTTFNIAWNSSPMAKLDMRVYYDYYDKQNNSTQVGYARGFQGSSCAATPANSATCYTIGPLAASEGYWYTKNAAGVDLSYAFDRNNKLLGGWDWEQIKRELADAPKSDDNRLWVEYRNNGSVAGLTGRLKYEYLQRRSDLVNTAAQTSVTYWYTAYDVNNFDSNIVKFNVDYAPIPKLLLGFGATWRQVDYKDNLYGRTKDDNQVYDVTASWGDDKFRVTGIGNWGKLKYNQAYLNGNYPAPQPNSGTNFEWSSSNAQDGWMAAASVDWVPIEKLTLNGTYSYQKTSGGVDFTSGNTTAGGGFLGGPLVNYDTDNTTLQRFQLKGTYTYSPKWLFNAGYAYEKYSYSDGQMAGYGGYYPYFQNLNTAAVGSNYSWYSGAFANPSYKTNLFWLTVTYKFDPPPQVYNAPKVAQAAPAPVAAPVAPPPPAPAPAPAPAPQVQKITLDSKVLFAFDKAVLTPEGKAAIDSMVIAKLATMTKLDVVLVTGYTDRIGTEAYNQKLSERRADAVRDYLVSKGVDKAKIEAIGLGEKQPVVTCDQKNLKQLIECLQPNRRVTVEAKGEAKK